MPLLQSKFHKHECKILETILIRKLSKINTIFLLIQNSKFAALGPKRVLKFIKIEYFH